MEFLLLLLLLVSTVSVSGGYGTHTKGQHESAQDISQDLFDSLEELAHIVDISYCVGGTGIYKPFKCLSRCGEFENFELVTTWKTGPLLSDSCGYIALSHPPAPKRIIVAFRGTYSITNAILDLSAYPQSYVPYPGPGPGPGEDTNKTKCTDCTVHAGFMAAWENTRAFILDHIVATREKYPDYKLKLVGHSLGGAVAALAGLEMSGRGWDPEVTTFGEPRVGNDAFVGFLDEAFNLSTNVFGSERRFRRVTHVNDPVPLLPLEEWGYKMHASEVYISNTVLPPSVSDILLCEGDQDERCIAGSESAAIMLDELRSLALARMDGLERRGQSQAVLSNTKHQPDYLDDNHSSVGMNWDLIPSRYRLWEVLFAHRDYFSRLGLCVPGGDPTGSGFSGNSNPEF